LVVLCIYVRNEEVPSNPNPADMGIVYPSGDTAFKALLSARFCAAIWNYISDCDETFNYWEPVSELCLVNLRSHELAFMASALYRIEVTLHSHFYEGCLESNVQPVTVTLQVIL